MPRDQRGYGERMSNEKDRRVLDEEFERLRESGRVVRDPGGIGYDVESLPDFFDAVAHLWDAKFASDCDTLHRAVAAQFPVTEEPLRVLRRRLRNRSGTRLHLRARAQRAGDGDGPGTADAR